MAIGIHLNQTHMGPIPGSNMNSINKVSLFEKIEMRK